MSADNFLTRIISRLKAGKRALPPAASPYQSGEVMSKLLQMVENTDEVEIACDEVFEILDQYVELEMRGADVAALLPLVKKHLDKCRDCHEEYEALVRIFEATSMRSVDQN
jgi:hypothetical protein